MKVSTKETDDVPSGESCFQTNAIDAFHMTLDQNKNDFDNHFAHKACKYIVKYTVNLDSEVENRWLIRVTHKDIQALGDKRISKVFRRFGRIVNLKFDYQSVFWSFEYGAEKNAQKAVYAILQEKLFGYKLCLPSDELLIEKNDSKSVKCSGESIETLSPINIQFKNNRDRLKSISNFLRIDCFDNYMNIEDLCRIVIRIQIPIKIVQTFDLISKRNFFLIEFNYCFEASDVLYSLNNSHMIRKQLIVKFE